MGLVSDSKFRNREFEIGVLTHLPNPISPRDKGVLSLRKLIADVFSVLLPYLEVKDTKRIVDHFPMDEAKGVSRGSYRYPLPVVGVPGYSVTHQPVRYETYICLI